MTMRATTKVERGLEDNLGSDIKRVTFYGIDLASGPDIVTIKCPKCGAPDSLTAANPAPTQCWNCRVPFRYGEKTRDDE